jgi:hypothetical protein
MLSKVPEGMAKTVFLTSTFPKRVRPCCRKSCHICVIGKKVLLIGMDIRKPRLLDYLDIPERGFTNYLSSKDLKPYPSYEGYDDFILCLQVSFRQPAELLMSKKVDAVSYFENAIRLYYRGYGSCKFSGGYVVDSETCGYFIYVAQPTFGKAHAEYCQ